MTAAVDPDRPRRKALIALGSNLGDRLKTLCKCIHFLDTYQDLIVVARSRIYESPPVGPVLNQPAFLNAAIVVATELEPIDLLARCLRVEDHFGRVRTRPQGPRTLDLDIIAIQGVPTLDLPELILPHPRATARAFVLLPLLEIAPDWPINGKSVRDWAGEVATNEVRVFADCP